MKTPYRIKIATSDRTEVLQYISEKKSQGPFSVIDVGGSANAWSANVMDALVDFKPSNIDLKYKNYSFDITDYEAWGNLEADVAKNGKYDFSICSHTLEDIMDPKMVIKKLVKISKAGFIAIPSKYAEFTRNIHWSESCIGPHLGYIHHRWIFSFKNNKFIAYPKINFLEYNEISKIIGAAQNNNFFDLSFFWENDLNIEYINNNYLGPSPEAVVSYYRDLIHDDCDELLKL